MQRQYEDLDHGMETGDREIILTALKGISDIVVNNPLEDVAKIAMTLRDKDQPLLLDFYHPFIQTDTNKMVYLI